MIRKLFLVFLLFYAVFGNSIIPNKNIVPEPIPTTIINMEKPSDALIKEVKKFSDIVTDPADRTKIALFNYEFSRRVKNWDNVDTQKINDVYTYAGKDFFKKTLVDKYENLSEMLVSVMERCVGKDNHIITSEEKEKLQLNFSAISWVLVNKI